MTKAEASEDYDIKRIVKCMEISAVMLRLADKGNRKYHELNIQQADLLFAAAKRLAAQYEHNEQDSRNERQ